MADSGWRERESETFLGYGEFFIPRRDQISEAIVARIPVRWDEAALLVDFACGAGWLSAALLERFPAASVLALDGSETMRESAKRALERFAPRAQVRSFDLAELDWLAGLPPVRAFVSSLAVHHLDGAGKRELFRGLHGRLEAGGALLLADLLLPRDSRERDEFARDWDEEVVRQSRERFGDTRAFDRFVAERWNWYRFFDPDDKPDTLDDQLRWLREAGFTEVRALWRLAGHAVFGGFKSPAEAVEGPSR